MPVCFNTGEELGRNDLQIFLVDELGVPCNAAEISYAIYFVDMSPGPPGVEVLIGPPARTPVNPSVGEYYAALLVPPGAGAGDYRIRWSIVKNVGDEAQEVVQEFGVVNPTTGVSDGTPILSSCESDLVDKLRVMLRDNNPDRNYHFRPPEQEGTIKKYNRVFGYIWEDHELLCYLQMSLDWWNSFPPQTQIRTLNQLCQQQPIWRTFILWGAAVFATFALSANWVADEFDYNIGGISLSIEKSSKYESLKQNAEGQWEKATEAKARTVKFIRGLQQPKFGFGVRSSFGPNVGRGVLSPRSFV